MPISYFSTDDITAGNWGPSGGALLISYAAAANTRHVISGIAWSFRDTPSEIFDNDKGAWLSIYTGDVYPPEVGDLFAEFWITKSGLDSLTFPSMKAGPVGRSLNIRLADRESNWAWLSVFDHIAQPVG